MAEKTLSLIDDIILDTEAELVEPSVGASEQTFIKLTTKYKNSTNESKFPQVGLGTWQSKPGEVARAVMCALKCGYKHIDCAYCYANEDEVGEGLKKAIKEGIKRESIFVTSKLWSTDHHPSDVVPAIKRTLKSLQLDYLDLYLIHWPTTFRRGPDRFPKKKDGRSMDYGELVPIIDTWKAMEECVEMGLTKHIGLSNFNSKQITEICENANIKPAVLQCESHPYFQQRQLIQFCQRKGIVFTAYSPLGSPRRPWAKDFEPTVMTDETLIKIAKNKKKSVAQICIRFQVQRGLIVIPKSVTPSRIKTNLEVFDFELTNEEMQFIEDISKTTEYRYCIPGLTFVNGKPQARDSKHPFYPFNEPF